MRPLLVHAGRMTPLKLHANMMTHYFTNVRSFARDRAASDANLSSHRTGASRCKSTSPAPPIPKTLFGLFFEDINFGADGGLYPERVKNRSFEFPNPMMGWKQLDRGDPKGQL